MGASKLLGAGLHKRLASGWWKRIGGGRKHLVVGDRMLIS